MLTLTHPGPRTAPRLIACESRSSSAIVHLVPGLPLADQLFRALRSLGTESGIAELSSGSLSPISYCVPTEGTGQKAVSFSETRTTPEGHLVVGTATLGVREGKPFMHSHCVWVALEGQLQGGHLWAETRVGKQPPVVVLHALHDVELVSADDPETLMPVFTPRPMGDLTMPPLDSPSSPQHRSVVARICPNEDITTAVKTMCQSAGIQSAAIRGGIGSLIGATFTGPPGGGSVTVEGPGTEVATLVGHLTTDSDGNANITITCTLVDKFGQVHAGTLVPGENPVAITYELLIQEIDTVSLSSKNLLPTNRKEAHR
jgi:predicted DNA-binding protein with PD1-like motif